MQGSKRFIDWVNLLLGIWLIVSPWALGTFMTSTTATTVLIVMGVALVAFSLWALVRVEDRAAEWWNLITGAVLFVLPWVFRYTATRRDAWDSWIVGFVVVILTLITTSLMRGTHQREQAHHA